MKDIEGIVAVGIIAFMVALPILMIGMDCYNYWCQRHLAYLMAKKESHSLSHDELQTYYYLRNYYVDYRKKKYDS